MKKHLFFGIIFMLFSLGMVFGQESKKNMVTMGINFSGLLFPNPSIGYERSLSDNFAILIDVGTNLVLTPYADIQGRWYPWAKTFYLGLGLGIFGFNTPALLFQPSLPIAPMISPNIGWKINIGQLNNWAIILGFTARVVFDVYDINSIHIEHGVPEMSIKFGRKF